MNKKTELIEFGCFKSFKPFFNLLNFYKIKNTNLTPKMGTTGFRIINKNNSKQGEKTCVM